MLGLYPLPVYSMSQHGEITRSSFAQHGEITKPIVQNMMKFISVNQAVEVTTY